MAPTKEQRQEWGRKGGQATAKSPRRHVFTEWEQRWGGYAAMQKMEDNATRHTFTREDAKRGAHAANAVKAAKKAAAAKKATINRCTGQVKRDGLNPTPCMNILNPDGSCPSPYPHL